MENKNCKNDCCPVFAKKKINFKSGIHQSMINLGILCGCKLQLFEITIWEQKNIKVTPKIVEAVFTPTP